MPLDPSIILQAQPTVKLNDPLDSAAKALTMKHLLQQAQANDQTLSDQQSMRAAYKGALTPGQDGTPTLDRKAFLSQLPPMLAYQQGKALAADDLAATEQKRKSLLDDIQIKGQLLAMVPTGNDVPLAQKEQGWQQMLQKGQQLGVDVSNLSPSFPGDTYVSLLNRHLMSAKDQQEQANKDRDFGFKQQEHSDRVADIGVKREANQIAKGNQAVQQVSQMMESARGDGSVQQAQKDLYAAKKFGSLVSLYGDPNKLSPQQVALAATEVNKIASGQGTTQAELQHLTPSSIPGSLADAAQRFANHPISANQGAFVNAYKDYVNSLKKDAANVIKDKYTRVLNVNRSRLGDDNYNNFKSQYIDPVDKELAGPAEQDAAVKRLLELRAKAAGN